MVIRNRRRVVIWSPPVWAPVASALQRALVEAGLEVDSMLDFHEVPSPWEVDLVVVLLENQMITSFEEQLIRIRPNRTLAVLMEPVEAPLPVGLGQIALGGRHLASAENGGGTLRELFEEILERLDALPQVEGSVQRNFSPSTEAALERLGDQPASAAAFVRALHEIHPEYGGGMARRIDVNAGGRAQSGLEWVAEVRRLYREDAVPELHGRHVIRGLALLEPDLTKDLQEHGFLGLLESELERPLPELLSPEGRRLWEAEPVPPHSDRPATIDQLGRRVFANALADMVLDERALHGEKPESFLVHLHGPWGSGKTSVLGFIAERLRAADPPWVVVEFNAWQHERLGSPWWSLMSAVHRQGIAASSRVRAFRLRALRAWWAVRPVLPSAAAFSFVLGLVLVGLDAGWFRGAGEGKGVLAQAAKVAGSAAVILALLGTVRGALRGLRQAATAGSAGGADRFIRNTPDPMGLLVRRFKRVVWTIERPVIVFIDDMDRCQPQYLVDVLNGIQTLLIEAPVTYVVAADRRWLYDSYAKVYADFTSVGQEAGRPMGHLFLEKTFQLSASLPAIPARVRDAYWSRLLDGAAATEPPAPTPSPGAGPDLSGTTIEDVLEISSRAAQLPADEQAAVLEAAAERTSSAGVLREVEHRLLPFAPLLEPNPRAMKRLVNAYRIELQRLVAEGRQAGAGSVTPEQLALWTIVALRWPLLAGELARDPSLVNDPDAETELRGLLDSREVQAVIAGEGVRARLTVQAIHALTGSASPPRNEVDPPSSTDGPAVA